MVPTSHAIGAGTVIMSKPSTEQIIEVGSNKCISKIIANRLCVWLPYFIILNKFAFVKRCNIVDNIMLCQELVGIILGTMIMVGLY